MSVDKSIGIRFRELMSGHMTVGADVPEVGEKSQARRPFGFDLALEIKELQNFLDAALHTASIASGIIRWDGNTSQVIPGGTVVLYRTDEEDRARKYFDFTFAFQAQDGRRWDAEGHKYLHDDGLLDPLKDLSTVFLVLQGSDGSKAAGVTRVHIDELLKQLNSIQVTGTTDHGEQAAAKEAFFGFMDDELREVYPQIPQLFPHTNGP